MSFREAVPPRTTHQGLCPWTPLGTSVPQTPVPPRPNPGYATDSCDVLSDTALREMTSAASKQFLEPVLASCTIV